MYEVWDRHEGKGWNYTMQNGEYLALSALGFLYSLIPSTH